MIIQTIHPEIAFCRTGGDFDEKENVIILELVLTKKNYMNVLHSVSKFHNDAEMSNHMSSYIYIPKD